MPQPRDPTKLRALPDAAVVPDPTDPDVVAGLAPEPAGPERARTGRPWVVVLLGVLLVASLALLVWSRIELSESAARAEGLQEQVRFLDQVLTERDAEIAAQRARLADVRTRVQDLISVLDAPLAPPPAR